MIKLYITASKRIGHTGIGWYPATEDTITTDPPLKMKGYSQI